MSILPVVRHLARKLRYRALPELIGQRLGMDSLAMAEPLLLSLLWREGFESSTWWPNNFGVAVAKYDVMDVGFATATAALSSHAKRGLRVLQEFGFLENAAGAEDDFGPDTSCLDTLAEDVDEGATWIRLFLAANPARDLHDPRHRRDMLSMQLPNDYFPRTFVVTDACITNARGLWLLKHLWM